MSTTKSSSLAINHKQFLQVALQAGPDGTGLDWQSSLSALKGFNWVPSEGVS